MRDRLKEFADSVRLAPTNKSAERVVRIMLEEVAKDCPMHVLVQLGQSLSNCWQNEIRSQAEQN